MKKLFLLLTTYSLSLTTLYSQTVDGLIANYVKAIGGMAKMQSLKNEFMEGTVDLGKDKGGIADIKIWVETGKAVRYDITFKDKPTTFIVIATDTGWLYDPSEGMTKVEPLPGDANSSAQPQYDLAGILVNYKSHGYKAEYKGKENKTYTIDVTVSDKLTNTYSIDSATGYITNVFTKFVGADNINCALSNYQKTAEGYIVPETMNVAIVGGEVKFTTIKVNTEMDKSLFHPKR